MRLNVPVQKVIGSRAGVSRSIMRRPASAMKQATVKQASRTHVRVASANAAVPGRKSHSTAEEKEEEKGEEKVYSLRNPHKPLKAWNAPSTHVNYGYEGCRRSDNENDSSSEREIKVPKLHINEKAFNSFRLKKSPPKID